MKKLFAYLEQEVPRINAHLQKEVDVMDGLVRDVVGHCLLGKGKRVRPVLTLLTARALGHHSDDAYPIACSLEMIHAASLLHDDIR